MNRHTISLTRTQLEFLLTVLDATARHHVMLLRRIQAKRTAAVIRKQTGRKFLSEKEVKT